MNFKKSSIFKGSGATECERWIINVRRTRGWVHVRVWEQKHTERSPGTCFILPVNYI